jgi:hypothetical protein
MLAQRCRLGAVMDGDRDGHGQRRCQHRGQHPASPGGEGSRLGGDHVGRLRLHMTIRDWRSPKVNEPEGIWSVLKRGVLANLAAASFGHLIQVIRHGLNEDPVPAQPHRRLPRRNRAGPATSRNIDPHHELKIFSCLYWIRVAAGVAIIPYRFWVMGRLQRVSIVRRLRR